MNDPKVDPSKAVPIGGKKHRLGGFTFTSEVAPEQILAHTAEQFRKLLIQNGQYKAAKQASPFMQEPSAFALAIYLAEEVKAREELEQRVALLQGQVDVLKRQIGGPTVVEDDGIFTPGGLFGKQVSDDGESKD